MLQVCSMVLVTRDREILSTENVLVLQKVCSDRHLRCSQPGAIGYIKIAFKKFFKKYKNDALYSLEKIYLLNVLYFTNTNSKNILNY